MAESTLSPGKINKVLVLSDIHAGSNVALMVPQFTGYSGQTVIANGIQEMTYIFWSHMIKEWLPSQIKKGDKLAIVLNGDLFEGKHHRTTELNTLEMEDQWAVLMELFAPLLEFADELFVIDGTECHTGSMENSFGKAEGAVRDPETGRYSFRKLFLDVKGTLCAFRHHMPTAQRVHTESSQYSIQAVQELAQAARMEWKPPRVMYAAHRHVRGFFTDGDYMFGVTGAWQGLTRFGNKVVPHAAIKPRPSAHLLDFRQMSNGLPTPVIRNYQAPKEDQPIVHA